MAEAADDRKAALLLQLRLEPGELLVGTIAVADSAAPRSFTGWVELMAAIDALRDH